MRPAAPPTGDSCAREPIHIPGAIQPHGMLLAADPADLSITHASANAERWLGCAAADLLGTPLSTWIAAAGRDEALAWLHATELGIAAPHTLVLRAGDGSVRPFEASASRHDGRLVLDLESPTPDPEVGKALYHTRAAMVRLRGSADLADLCAIACEEIRRVTGMQRVLIYRFDADWSGHVLAEALAPAAVATLPSYAGLHFPASDIPEQARALYVLNPLRLIPDAAYVPAAVLARADAAARPLDLSYSSLRSVSPRHLEYLRNMGVRASLSISLLQEDRLWGLITCSSADAPTYVTPRARAACALLGEVVSSLLVVKEAHADRDRRRRLRKIRAELVARMAAEKHFVDGLVGAPPTLLQVAAATGAAVHLDGKTTCIGVTPPPAQLAGLLAWLAERPPGADVTTTSLPALYPPSHAFRDSACGLIAIPMSRGRNNYVMWFRPEVAQTRSWGGDPTHAEIADPDAAAPHPRRSFARWQQTVRLQSLPWRDVEREAAHEMVRAVVDVVMQRSEELAKVNLELERSNTELDAFAYAASHDLKEPLRGIHNYTGLVMRELGDAHLVGDTRQRMQTVIKLTHRMEDLINSLLHYAHVGRMALRTREVDLGALLASLSEVLRGRLDETATHVRIAGTLPVVRGDPVLLGEVFSNLITNALKYNDKAERRIEVGALEPVATATGLQTLFVRDNGLGIRERNLDAIFRIFRRLHGRDKYGGGTGTGLTIVRRIVERHGGTVWARSVHGEGSTFYFTLPVAQRPPQ